MSEADKRYYDDHREEIRQKHKQYYVEHHLDILRRQRERRARNPSHYREYGQRYTQRVRQELFSRLGGKCIKCEFSDPRALQIDHVNGGGRKELETIKGKNKGYYLYLRKLSNAELKRKYQLLCANCNWIKRSENMEVSRESKGRPIVYALPLPKKKALDRIKEIFSS